MTELLNVIKHWGILLGLGGGMFALDQVAKSHILNNYTLGQYTEISPLLHGFIYITRSHNTGAAFGMFPSGSPVFLVLALVTVTAFVIMYPRLPENAWLSRVAIALVTGGALSNAVDRVMHGFVVDYVYVQLPQNMANISNFADHAITVGVILLFIDQWAIERREVRASELAEELAHNAEMPPTNDSETTGTNDTESSPDSIV